MKPKQLIKQWVAAFNHSDYEVLAEMYAEDAVNHHVAESPVQGKEAIRQMFKKEFALAEMTYLYN